MRASRAISALATVGRLDYLHRDLAFVVLVGAAVLTLWLLSRAIAVLIRWSFVVLALAVLQVVLGVVMAYGSLLPAAQVGHLTIASLLLGAETVLWLLAGGRAYESPSRLVVAMVMVAGRWPVVRASRRRLRRRRISRRMTRTTPRRRRRAAHRAARQSRFVSPRHQDHERRRAEVFR